MNNDNFPQSTTPVEDQKKLSDSNRFDMLTRAVRTVSNSHMEQYGFATTKK